MKKVLILLIMILFFCSQLYAQKLTVKGKVLDAETKDLVRYATGAFYDEIDVLI